MVGSSLATFALFGLTRGSRAYESIDRIVSGVFRFDFLSCWVFLGSVFGIPLLKLKLKFTLAAFYEVAHLPNSFVLKGFETLISHETFQLVLHHDCRASWVKALEVSALVDEFRIDVLVDTGHAEDVPAVVNVKEDFSIKIFIVFAIALSTLDYLGFVHVEVRISIGFLHYLRLHLGWFCAVFGVEFTKYFAERPFLLVRVVIVWRWRDGVEPFEGDLYLLTEELSIG